MPAAKTSAPEPVNQLSIIRSGRWKAATFTTFTFNAAFFEAYVLPRLHEAGCEEVTVLVDELFYLASLAENPRHVGTAYRLLPVSLADGVFHAKLTYLQGAGMNDLFLVGSGNLTWPGYGHQLECLDVLQAGKDGPAFRDLATICRELLARPDFRPGDAASALKALAARAERIGEAGGANSSVRLLAPNQEPIANQVARALRGRQFRELIVVSPFHSPDAGPCVRLARSLGIGKLRVALDAASGSTPLSENISSVEFVQREDEETRATHAKWYEFRGAESWLLSGSVNATRTSLETTANFELATLRELPSARLPRWSAAKPDNYSVGLSEFARANEDEYALFVSARGNKLVGGFVRAKDVGGEWRAELVHSGVRMRLGKVTVVEGTFELEMPRGIDTEPTQLVLTQAKRAAMAWVMFENELRMSTAEREFAKKVRRLASPDAAPGDFIAVLGWLAERVARLGIALRQPARRDEASGADEDIPPEKVFDFHRWSLGVGSATISRNSLLGSCQTALRALAQYSKSVAEGHGVNREAGEGDFAEDGDDRDVDKEVNGSDAHAIDALGALEKALRRNLEDGVDEVEAASFVLEAALWTLIMQDRNNRQAILDSVPFVQWTALASPYRDRFPGHEAIAGLTLATCACGFSVTKETDARRERFASLARATTSCIPQLQASAVAEAQLSGRPCFSLLTPDDRGRAVLAVDAMLRHEGFGAKLRAYLENIDAGGRFGPPPSELVSQTGGLLSAIVNKTIRQQPMRRWDDVLPTRCSDRCYHQFDSSDMSVLRNRRAVRCIQCGTLHFWTGVTV